MIEQIGRFSLSLRCDPYVVCLIAKLTTAVFCFIHKLEEYVSRFS